MKILFLGDVTFRKFKPYLEKYNIESVLVSYEYGEEKFLADKNYSYLEEASPQEILLIAERENVTSVISRVTPAVEETLVRDAMVKELIEKELKIPVITHPIKSASITVDKGYTRHFLHANNIPIPTGFVITGEEQLIEKMKGFAYPCVIKNPISSNAEEVYLINNLTELKEKYYKIQSKRVVVEEFIQGIELGVEILGMDGKYKVFPPAFLGQTDLNLNPQNRFRYSPYDLQKYEAKFNSLVLKIAKILDICGIIEIDIIFDGEKFYIIDINGRTGGVSSLNQASNDINPYEEIIKMAISDWYPPDTTKNFIGIDTVLKDGDLDIINSSEYGELIDIRGYYDKKITTLRFNSIAEVKKMMRDLERI